MTRCPRGAGWEAGPVMAALAARTAHIVSRSWSSAVAGISRSVGGSSSSSVLQQHRSYTDEVPEGRVPVPSIPEPLAAPADPIAAAEALSSEVLPAAPKLETFVPTGRPIYDRGDYPPRTYRTPRGVYKAIVLGEVGQLPVQKILKSGRSVTIFSVGTGGMYNNRRPFEGETPEEFAERSYTQWHRVAVYQDRVASMVMQHVKVGSQVYLEGNIESRVYNDPNSGIVKRIREIAIRANGRLMFMETPIGPSVSRPAATQPPAANFTASEPPPATQAEA